MDVIVATTEREYVAMVLQCVKMRESTKHYKIGPLRKMHKNA